MAPVSGAGEGARCRRRVPRRRRPGPRADRHAVSRTSRVARHSLSCPVSSAARVWRHFGHEGLRQAQEPAALGGGFAPGERRSTAAATPAHSRADRTGHSAGGLLRRRLMRTDGRLRSTQSDQPHGFSNAPDGSHRAALLASYQGSRFRAINRCHRPVRPRRRSGTCLHPDSKPRPATRRLHPTAGRGCLSTVHSSSVPEG